MKFIDKITGYLKENGIWFVIGAGILYSPFIVGLFKSSMTTFGMWWLAIWANPMTPAIPMCMLFGYMTKKAYKLIQKSNDDDIIKEYENNEQEKH